MTSSGESRLSFTCPGCQKRMTASVRDAGKRCKCPKCGRKLKLPGSPTANSGQLATDESKNAESQRPNQTADTHQGIANISLICPVCGTRMYATSKQIGQSMVCPDCLESVTVKRPERVAPPTTETHAGTKTPPLQDSRVQGNRKESERPDSAEEDDDFRLSDPVDLSPEHFLPKALTDALDSMKPDSPTGSPAADALSAATGADDNNASHRSSTAEEQGASEPDEPEQFAIHCKICDTRLYATDDEIGKTKTCPDCYSVFVVQQPIRQARKKTNVMDAGGGDFALDKPADSTTPSAPSGLLEQARQTAVERERQQTILPKYPLWTGVFRFLPEPGVLAHGGTATLFLAVIAILIFGSLEWMKGDGSAQFLAIIAIATAMVLFLFWYVFTTATCLFILQKSSEGVDRMSNWPEMDFGEWFANGLFVLAAGLYSVAPGMVMVWLWNLLGLPNPIGRMPLVISLFVFFPIVQLSLLEGISISTPLTRPVLKSLLENKRLWILFYIETWALAATVAFAGSFMTFEVNVMIVPMAAIGTFGLMIYFRLLGRLTWACQTVYIEDEDDEQ